MLRADPSLVIGLAIAVLRPKQPVRSQAEEQGIKVKSLQQPRQTRLTIWVKEHGLRKAQYMASFKSISGIERYKTQHLEDLQKQLESYHPFK